MSKSKRIAFLLVGCFLLALAVLPVRSEGNRAPSAQTIPTRTPTGEPAPNTDTPPPPPPTETSPPGGGEPTDAPPPTATNSTPLPTLPFVTPTQTPAGGSGFIPTAAACGSAPTLQAKNLINVRSGPGTNYPIAGTLAFGEVRHIVGRAAHTDWWAIEMPADLVGWVADPVVTVSGYTGDIPILEAPPINGQTPTPGTPWNPTPNSICPTATPTLTPTPSRTPPPTTTGTAAGADQTATAQAAVTDTPQATATQPPTDTATPLPPGLTPTLPLVGENPTVPPVDPTTSPPTTNRNGWVLYAGIGLVVIGGAAYVLLSRR